MESAGGAWRGGGIETPDRKHPPRPTTTLPTSHVSEADVRSALKAGTVVLAKSDLDAAPCAKLVVEEGARVTAVVSACPADTGVVTVWDRTHDWVCDCPT